jgi:hypothetical protein
MSSYAWKKEVEKILEEQYRETLKKLSELGSSDVPVSAAVGDNTARCEAIIAKGKRENLRCNARAQKDSTRCKTHSKVKTLVQNASVSETFPIDLTSLLEPDIVFGVKNEDGTVTFNDLPKEIEKIF